jgi:hypothetical protein
MRRVQKLPSGLAAGIAIHRSGMPVLKKDISENRIVKEIILDFKQRLAVMSAITVALL